MMRLNFIRPFFTMLLSLAVAATALLPESAAAQQSITTGRGGTINFYSEQDGLPGNLISQSLLTRDGYWWLRTNGGIVRFNGTEFETLGAEVHLSEMQIMAYDSLRNVMWFADSVALVRYDGKTFSRTDRTNGSSPGESVQRLFADKSGRLWMVTGTPSARQHLALFDNGKLTVFDSTAYPLDNVHRICEAANGDIWFTTGSTAENMPDRIARVRGGVARYRNGRFEKFDASNGFPYPFATSMLCDKHGNLWFGCSALLERKEDAQPLYGVVKYDGNTFETFPEVQALVKRKPFYQQFNLGYSEETDEVFLSLRVLSEDAAYSAADLSQSVYVYRNGKWNPVTIAPPQTLLTVQSPPLTQTPNLPARKGAAQKDVRYRGFFLDRQGGALVAALYHTPAFNGISDFRYYRYENGAWKLEDAFKQAMHAAGNAVCGRFVNNYPNGFGLYFPPRSVRFTAESGLIKNTPSVLYSDKQGNVWILYQETWDAKRRQWNAGGLSLWNGERLQTFSTADGLPSNYVESVYQDSKLRLWVCTDKGIALGENRFGKVIFTPVVGTDGNPFWATKMLERRNGEVWTYNAAINNLRATKPSSFYLGKFTGAAFESQPFPFDIGGAADSLRAAPLQHLTLDETAGALVASWKGCTEQDFRKDGQQTLGRAPVRRRLLADKGWEDIPASWQMPPTDLMFAGAFPDGRYYLSRDNFFYRFNGSRFINLTENSASQVEAQPDSASPSDESRDDETASSRSDRRFAAQNDFTLFRQHALAEHYRCTLKQGDEVYLVFTDTSNGSGKGIVAFDGKTTQYLTRNSGLPTSSLSATEDSKDTDGNLVFATPKGAVIYNGQTFQTVTDDAAPSFTGASGAARDRFGNVMIVYPNEGITLTRLDRTKPSPPLPTLRAGRRTYTATQPIDLEYERNSVRVRFSSMAYRNPAAVKYSVMLEGFDRNGSDYKPESVALYRNLPEGEYTFRVKALSPDGVESDEASFKFVIRPPYYRTLWFISLCIAGVALAGVGIYQARVQGIKAQNKRLENEVQRQTAEIRTKSLELEKKSGELEKKSVELEKNNKVVAAQRDELGAQRDELQAKRDELETQRDTLQQANQKLEKTLSDLQATQEQLVQKEKMASLGELVAGIAHEIQNPLNFVNNFAEVSVDLCKELGEELEKENLSDEVKGFVGDLMSDLSGNMEKINHHGKRAENIVKGMLQHSRQSTGEKTPTDVNALVDEFFKLSYHGLRAKDKSFNASMQTDYDAGIGKVNLCAADIGRVALNLFNNAFFAVTEKHRDVSEATTASIDSALSKTNGSAEVKKHEPEVRVQTRNLGDKIEIRIKDNGKGISKENLKKIFQPFFTTKKGTAGTGLGLSISFDIVVKGHGGDIRIESEEGAGAEFIITLPKT